MDIRKIIATEKELREIMCSVLWPKPLVDHGKLNIIVKELDGYDLR
jgi:hypothetical protein